MTAWTNNPQYWSSWLIHAETILNCFFLKKKKKKKWRNHELEATTFSLFFSLIMSSPVKLFFLFLVSLYVSIHWVYVGFQLFSHAQRHQITRMQEEQGNEEIVKGIMQPLQSLRDINKLKYSCFNFGERRIYRYYLSVRTKLQCANRC